MEEKKVAEGKKELLTNARVHTWLAWRGSARAADQARLEVDFTGGGVATQGASTGDASTYVV
jgi:hypothetical protein